MAVAGARVGALPVSGHIRAALRRSRRLRSLVVTAHHSGLRPDDIFVASFPRSGNTWMRFVIADLATGRDIDFETVDQLIPNVGHHAAAPELVSGHRLIKTHEAYRPEYGRAVYLVRDVRDVLISWYRVTRSAAEDYADLDRFVRDFVTHRASPYGAWCEHVRGWQRARERGSPILVCRFEDVRADPHRAVSEITQFIGLPVDGAAINRALERNSVENMSRLETASVGYLRRASNHRSSGVGPGVSGMWRTLLTAEHLDLLAPARALGAELGYPD